MRHCETERLGGVEIDDQLECRRPLDRQIGRIDALEDPSGVNVELAIGSREPPPIADQAAALDEFTPRIDRRNGMA